MSLRLQDKVAIVTGSIWARPSWGTWWTWDPRLTTAAILEMISSRNCDGIAGMDAPSTWDWKK
jgi:heme exporter protein C